MHMPSPLTKCISVNSNIMSNIRDTRRGHQWSLTYKGQTGDVSMLLEWHIETFTYWYIIYLPKLLLLTIVFDIRKNSCVEIIKLQPWITFITSLFCIDVNRRLSPLWATCTPTWVNFTPILWSWKYVLHYLGFKNWCLPVWYKLWCKVANTLSHSVMILC